MMGFRGWFLVVASGALAATATERLGPGAAGVVGSGEGIVAPRVEADWSEARSATSIQVAPSYQQVLNSVRGLDPTACGLVQRTLGNRWGPGGIHPAVDEPDGAGPSGRMALDRMLNDEPGPEQMDGLLEALGDRDRCVRNVAARFLGWMKDPTPVAALRPMVAGPPTTALPALRTLGHGEWEEGLPMVLGALDRPEAEIRAAAAWALGEYERAATVADLEAVLSDSDVSVRRTALWALGRIERRVAVPAIIPHLEDAETSVRLNAAWALGKIEDSSAIPALVARLTSDPDPVVRNVIAWALGQIE